MPHRNVNRCHIHLDRISVRLPWPPLALARIHLFLVLSTQPASPSVPQTTLALLPAFTETASASARRRRSPAAYRLRSILIDLLQVVSVIVIRFV